MKTFDHKTMDNESGAQSRTFGGNSATSGAEQKSGQGKRGGTSIDYPIIIMQYKL